MHIIWTQRWMIFLKIFICVLLKKGSHISGITKESVNDNNILIFAQMFRVKILSNFYM